MKKILICLIALVAVSCLPDKQEIVSSELQCTTEGYFKYIEYDGHEYLVWKSRGYVGGITHSPNCPCQNNK